MASQASTRNWASCGTHRVWPRTSVRDRGEVGNGWVFLAEDMSTPQIRRPKSCVGMDQGVRNTIASPTIVQRRQRLRRSGPTGCETSKVAQWKPSIWCGKWIRSVTVLGTHSPGTGHAVCRLSRQAWTSGSWSVGSQHAKLQDTSVHRQGQGLVMADRAQIHNQWILLCLVFEGLWLVPLSFVLVFFLTSYVCGGLFRLRRAAIRCRCLLKTPVSASVAWRQI